MVLEIIAALLVVLGALFMTIGVYGAFRLPTLGTKLHASSKAIALGIVPMLLATALVGGGAMAARACLAALFLLVTTPVSSHVIAQAGRIRRPRD